MTAYIKSPYVCLSQTSLTIQNETKYTKGTFCKRLEGVNEAVAEMVTLDCRLWKSAKIGENANRKTRSTQSSMESIDH